VRSNAVWLAYAKGQLDTAEAIARERSASPSMQVQRGGHRIQSALAYAQGELAKGDRERTAAAEIALRQGVVAEPIAAAVDIANARIVYRNDKAGALAVLDAALRAQPLDGIPLADRPYAELAEVYARADRIDRARQMIAGLEKRHAEAQTLTDDTEKHRALAVIAVSEKRYDDALRELDQAEGDACTICSKPLRALAYDLKGQPDSAIAQHEATVADHTFFRVITDELFLGGTYKRLGELYEAKGERAKAIENYEKFVELWKSADPELQPKVREVRDKLAWLRRQGG